MPATATSRTEGGLPPGPPLPKAIQSLGGALGSLFFDESFLRAGPSRYGDLFTVKIFGLGTVVIVCDPELIKQVFRADPETLHAGDRSPLRAVLGEHSLLAIDEDEHMRQRKLLLPPFHGERMREYDAMIEEEAIREIGSWPSEGEFRTLEPMMRITLNAILRAVFGARGRELDELGELLPQMVVLGSRLAGLPFLHRDLGAWSPWGRFVRMRRRSEEIVAGLIDEARRDPALDRRGDVLALLAQARHEDGTQMSDREIYDQLGTVVVAGHETTATTLAWAVDRLRRRPELLARLVEEADAGGSELREATIKEVQRMRPVIFGAGRFAMKPFELGGYTLPAGTTIALAAVITHYDPRLFENPREFRPERFIGAKPSPYAFFPFGGGIRRCIGAAFAQMEMDVVLRTLLREVELLPTNAPGERWRFRGVAFAPGDGGLARVRRRGTPEEFRDAPLEAAA